MEARALRAVVLRHQTHAHRHYYAGDRCAGGAKPVQGSMRQSFPRTQCRRPQAGPVASPSSYANPSWPGCHQKLSTRPSDEHRDPTRSFGSIGSTKWFDPRQGFRLSGFGQDNPEDAEVWRRTALQRRHGVESGRLYAAPALWGWGRWVWAFAERPGSVGVRLGVHSRLLVRFHVANAKCRSVITSAGSP